MSSKLHVYVGPYAECRRVGAVASWGDIIAEVESDLTIGTDENLKDGIDRWVPNREHKDSVTFDPHSDNQPFLIDGNVGTYRDAFESRFFIALEVLRSHYGNRNVKVRYGALPCWR